MLNRLSLVKNKISVLGIMASALVFSQPILAGEFETLPNELIELIVKRLESAKDFGAFSNTCTAFHAFANDFVQKSLIPYHQNSDAAFEQAAENRDIVRMRLYLHYGVSPETVQRIFGSYAEAHLDQLIPLIRAMPREILGNLSVNSLNFALFLTSRRYPQSRMRLQIQREIREQLIAKLPENQTSNNSLLATLREMIRGENTPTGTTPLDGMTSLSNGKLVDCQTALAIIDRLPLKMLVEPDRHGVESPFSAVDHRIYLTMIRDAIRNKARAVRQQEAHPVEDHGGLEAMDTREDLP